MAGLVLALFLLAALTDTGTCVSRADVNDVRLNDLDEKLDGLVEKLEGASGVRERRAKELADLQGRLDDLENAKDGCGKREFRCGSIFRDCISDTLVCDGSPDCQDGSDESDCVNPASAGKSFHGDVYNLKCFTDIAPVHIGIDVISETRNSWFSTVTESRVILHTEYADGRSAEDTYDAIYYFGKKTLVVYPNEGDGLAITCHFRTTSSDYCHAEIRALVNQNVCGEAILLEH